MAQEPKFAGMGCTSCKFYGHWHDHDIYVCQSKTPSLIAKFNTLPANNVRDITKRGFWSWQSS